MAKYVIELDDEPCMREDGYNFYACKTVPWWSISDTIINRLTPYIEPDRKAIEDEVWEFATICTKMNGADSVDVFGGFSLDSFTNYSYQEAKAKYEEWRKRKDEIRVGCEVQHKKMPGLKIYVTDMDENSFGGFALCNVEEVCDYGDRFSGCDIHQYKPTGRVFPNIVELLKKTKED
jgi:hypothetical protein